MTSYTHTPACKQYSTRHWNVWRWLEALAAVMTPKCAYSLWQHSQKRVSWLRWYDVVQDAPNVIGVVIGVAMEHCVSISCISEGFDWRLAAVGLSSFAADESTLCNSLMNAWSSHLLAAGVVTKSYCVFHVDFGVHLFLFSVNTCSLHAHVLCSFCETRFLIACLL